MKLAKIGMIFALFALTTSSFAANNLRSSNVMLPGGTINPKESLSFGSDQLVQAAYYNVVCTISNTVKNDPATIQISTSPYSSSIITLNGNQTSGNQVKLTQINNSLQVSHVNSYYDSVLLSIVNLDQTNPITVNNCYAVAESNN